MICLAFTKFSDDQEFIQKVLLFLNKTSQIQKVFRDLLFNLTKDPFFFTSLLNQKFSKENMKQIIELLKKLGIVGSYRDVLDMPGFKSVVLQLYTCLSESETVEDVHLDLLTISTLMLEAEVLDFNFLVL